VRILIENKESGDFNPRDVQKFQVNNGFWNLSIDEVMEKVQTSSNGITETEARERLIKFGYNKLKPKKRTDSLFLFLAQFKSPIILILIITSILAFLTADKLDTLIIITIVFASSFIGFWEERMASNAVEALLSIVHIKTTVIRDGLQKQISIEDVVPGDLVILSAGDVIPGDSRIVDSKDLFVDEASLTGETFPSEKTNIILDETTPLNQRINSLFMGTHVVSGRGKAIIVETGLNTEFGKISEHLTQKEPINDFERGIKRFGYVLMEIVLILVIIVFGINVYVSRPVIDSFLFAIALAVGLTPQLLPAVISVNLTRGSKRMADVKVIVKKPTAIENFGSMNILCSDKTGTLTEGKMKLHSALNIYGEKSERLLKFAYINAYFQDGFKNPIDEALSSQYNFNLNDIRKTSEIPYDFIRKRLSILVDFKEQSLIVTKGAVPNILQVCTTTEISEDNLVDISKVEALIQNKYKELSSSGFRTLGVSYRFLDSSTELTKELESKMIFLGFLIFYDPPKSNIQNIIKDLKELNISLKIITGDNRFIAQSLGKELGWSQPNVITGNMIREMSNEALLRESLNVDIFAEVEPNQKERIILALRKSGNVVGYMGDGINDASALHAADIGISVESAVDVAKEAAQIVLLEKDLTVLLNGIQEGRRTFINTIKYIWITISANLGNMVSMAIASLFLPFLPLLPEQLLVINFLTDFPSMTIATDSVDEEMVQKPKRWDIRFITEFMVIFGLASAFFDIITFFVLLVIFQASITEFRTGWFLVSILTELFILFVIRTKRQFYESLPSKSLLITSIVIAIITLIIPFTPLGEFLGFIKIPLLFLLYIAFIIIVYIITSEGLKKIFYQRVQF